MVQVERVTSSRESEKWQLTFHQLRGCLSIKADMRFLDGRQPFPPLLGCDTVLRQRGTEAMLSENSRLVLRVFMELWNDGKLAVAGEIFAADYVNHDPVSAPA